MAINTFCYTKRNQSPKRYSPLQNFYQNLIKTKSPAAYRSAGLDKKCSERLDQFNTPAYKCCQLGAGQHSLCQ